MKTIKELRELITNRPARSAWDKGVTLYALELLEDFRYRTEDSYIMKGSYADEKNLLNGATNWSGYSYGAGSLIYNPDYIRPTPAKNGLMSKLAHYFKRQTLLSDWRRRAKQRLN